LHTRVDERVVVVLINRRMKPSVVSCRAHTSFELSFITYILFYYNIDMFGDEWEI